MWPYKHNKPNQKPAFSGPACAHCGSSNTRVIASQGTNHRDFVRTWRGQRYITCRCDNCNRDFYVAEGKDDSIRNFLPDDETVDQDELLAAEEEIKKQIEDDGDRRCR